MSLATDCVVDLVSPGNPERAVSSDDLEPCDPSASCAGPSTSNSTLLRPQMLQDCEVPDISWQPNGHSGHKNNVHASEKRSRNYILRSLQAQRIVYVIACSFFTNSLGQLFLHEQRLRTAEKTLILGCVCARTSHCNFLPSNNAAR